MKVEREDIKIKEQFIPFNLVISIESEEEARAMYAIFNHTRNIRLLPIHKTEIRNIIGMEYSANNHELISGNVSWGEFYK